MADYPYSGFSTPTGAVWQQPTSSYQPGQTVPYTPGDPTHGGLYGTAPTSPYSGADPFAYTNGSLLTPYTQQFTYPGVYGAPQTSTGIPAGGDLQSQVIALANQAGRPDIAANPQYWMDQIAGKGQGPGGANGPIDTGYWFNRFQTANTGMGGGMGSLSPMSPFQYGDFNYSPQQVSGVSAPTPFSNPYSDFSFGAYSAPQQFNPTQFGYDKPLPPDFKAPTLDETNDPGYKFRLEQAQQAIQNQSAAQGARGGDVLRAMQDYAQNYASSEYANVYQRALSGYQANLAGQQQGYGQAYNTSALNSQTAQQAAAFNEQARLAAYGANWNTSKGVYDTNFNNAFNIYNANAGNQLQAAALNEQAQATNANLGWQAASGVYDRNYQNALNAYQMQWQQQLQAAQLGMQGSQLGLQAQNQGFNQALTAYGTNADIYNRNQTNQFNRLYSMGQMGQGGANSLDQSAGAYANAMGGYYTGQGNSAAGATMAGGNAWGGALTNAGNLAGGIGMYYGMPGSFSGSYPGSTPYGGGGQVQPSMYGGYSNPYFGGQGSYA